MNLEDEQEFDPAMLMDEDEEITQEDAWTMIYKINFGQIYLSQPLMTESDGGTSPLFPKQARLRDLTYSAPLYVDVSESVFKKGHDGEEITETQDFPKVFIGK
ncbi:DNA-directed RNA polymerase II subunit RPB2-like, partial [Trifolium medium]|nr:DNA-directed RNA polymerase II subunit RPB2-like [Trifolium medium]